VVEVVERRLAVFNVRDLVRHAEVGEAAPHDLGVRVVVFDKQDVDGIAGQHVGFYR